MKKNYKVALITFSGGLVVLAAFLWMPMLAGPDGLERVLFNLTNNEEYEPESTVDYTAAPFPDYEFQIGENGYIQTWLIGLIGAFITAIVMFGLSYLVVKRSKKRKIIEEEVGSSVSSI